MTNKELDWIFYKNKPLGLEYMFIGLPLSYLAVLIGLWIFEKLYLKH